MFFAGKTTLHDCVSGHFTRIDFVLDECYFIYLHSFKKGAWPYHETSKSIEFKHANRKILQEFYGHNFYAAGVSLLKGQQ